MDSKIYLPTLLITLSFMVQCQQPITCDAGHFKAGETASVTCNFHQNLEDIGHHVYVTQHPLDAPDDSVGNDVALCFRFDGHELICEAAKGVQINTDITDRLTVHIPDVTTDFAGRYVCQLVPPDDLVMVFCSLTVEEGTFTQTKTDTENVAESDKRSWWKFVAIAISCLCGIISGVTCFRWFRSKRNFIGRKLHQYNSKIRKDLNVQVVAEASVGLSDHNDYSDMKPTHDFNKKHHPTVSRIGLHDSPVCQDMSFRPIKPHDSSTCQAGSCIYNPLESQNDQIDIPSSKRVSSVGSNSSTSSSMQSFLCVDDFHSSTESDGSCSFYSSTDVLEKESLCSHSGGVLFIAESCPPIVAAADPAEGVSAD